MRMDEGLDTGDMIMKQEVIVDEDETGGSLFDKLSGVGAKLCVKTMEAIENGTAVYTPQDDAACNSHRKDPERDGKYRLVKRCRGDRASGARLKSMAECIYKDR